VFVLQDWQVTGHSAWLRPLWPLEHLKNKHLRVESYSDWYTKNKFIVPRSTDFYLHFVAKHNYWKTFKWKSDYHGCRKGGRYRGLGFLYIWNLTFSCNKFSKKRKPFFFSFERDKLNFTISPLQPRKNRLATSGRMHYWPSSGKTPSDAHGNCYYFYNLCYEVKEYLVKEQLSRGQNHRAVEESK